MKTDELQLFYPDFVPNQVLTNTQLNQLRTYLDEQSRLTRIRLVGRGIACGLTWHVENLGGSARRVVIFEGYGISSDGYLVELYAGEGAAPPAQSVAYTGVRPYVDAFVDEDGAPKYEHWQQLADPTQQIDLLELVPQSVMGTEDAPDDADPLTASDLTGKVVVLYLEADEEELKSCLVTDCDNKGLNIYLRPRVLLVDQAALETWDPCGSPLTTRVEVPRLHASLRDASSGPTHLSDVDAADEIDAGYGRIVKGVRDEITAVIENAYAAYGSFLGLDEDDKDDAVSTLEALLADGIADADFHQYHYDFAKDVAAACNEFVRAACDLMADCCPEYDFPRHLMVGAVDGTEGYRHTFVPSPVRNVTHADLARTTKLFRRIQTIIDAFDPDTFTEATEIRVTPSRTERDPLGTRALPYYYGFSEDVRNAWQPVVCCSTEALWSYFAGAGGDGAPVNPFDAAYAAVSLFRIEGHLNGSCDAAVSTLESLKQADNLEFHVLPLRLTSAAEESDDAVDEMLEIVARIEATQLEFRLRQIMDLVEVDAGWYQDGAAVDAFRESVAEEKDDLYQRNREWAAARLARETHCGVDAFQADYLLLRNEFLADYKRIYLYLTALLDFLVRLQDILLEDLPEYVSEREALSRAADFAARVEELLARESALQEQIDSTEDATVRQQLEQELRDVEDERRAYEDADETVRSLEEFLQELGGALGTGGEVSESPIIALVVGLVVEVANLRDHVHELVHYLLPADLRAFNYSLFDRKHGALVRATLDLRLLPLWVALYVFAAQSRDDLPQPEEEEDGLEIDLSNEVLSDLLENVAFDQETADILVKALQSLGGLWYLVKLFNGMHHNLMHVRFATAYYALEHIEAQHVFGAFAERHPGMEHLAGVEKGGTFLLVCDEDDVVADFALRGQVPCCCPFDPAELCLPPVAVPDFHIVVRTPEEAMAAADIDVLRNDYDLFDDSDGEAYEVDHELRLRIEPDGDASEQGFPIEIVETDDGIRIRYTNEEEDFYGIDGFRYRLIDERNEEPCVAVGHVAVLVVPGFVPEPEETGTLEGTVTVSGEEPLAGIDVEISGGERTFVETSGDAGIFRFTDVPAVSYAVSVASPQFEPFNGNVDVEADATTTFDIALSPLEVVTGRLTGTVFGSDGQVLEGAVVSIRDAQGLTQSTTSAANGRYAISALGTFTLTATALGHQPFTEAGIDVASGQTVTVDITLESSIIIEVVSIETASVGMVAEMENISIEEAEGRVAETYSARLGERMDLLSGLARDPQVATSEEFIAARDFMVATMTDDALTGDRLEAAYDDVSARLKAAVEAAPDEQKAAYRTMLESTTAQYLDRFTLENPADVSEETDARFTSVFTEMRDAGVDLGTFSTNFKAGDVNTNAENDSANHIDSLIVNL